ncbi:uncharacterized protein [Oscarella lobularis]|uniref:uncharacterized protein n=1 Tax=Oscarella lobularis TaxID=121494 RepID=UPI003313E72C
MIRGRGRSVEDANFVDDVDVDARSRVKKKKKRLKSGVLSFYDVDEDIGRHREGVVLVNFKEPTKSTGGGASRLAKLTTDQDQTKEVDYLLECDDAIDEYATRESAEFDSQRRDDESLLPGFLTARNDDDGDESAKKSESNEMEEALREFFAKERKHPKVVARRLASTVCKAMTRSSNLAKSIDTFGLPPVEAQLNQSHIKNELKISGYEDLLSPTIDLAYQCVFFVDKKSAFHRSVLPEGTAVLTSKRLLFLSLNEWKGKNLVYEDLQYKIVHTEGASAVYLPIPLSKIKSAEIVSSVEFRSTAEFVQKMGCCSHLFEYVLQGLRISKKITETIEEKASAGKVYHKRYIQLGVKMPPWGERTIINIRLAKNADMQQAVNFVSGVQKNAPNLFGFDSDADSSDGGSFTYSSSDSDGDDDKKKRREKKKKKKKKGRKEKEYSVGR